MQEVVAVYTEVRSAPARALVVNVRAYGTQRGGLGDHVEEAIEAALRASGAGAPGIAFDRDADARLSDQLFRARRAGFDAITLRLSALRALCAPVGGLDAADVATIAFYKCATDERPIALTMDDADGTLPAFVIAKTLAEALEPEPESEIESDPTPAHEPEVASVSLSQLIAESVSDSDESDSVSEPIAVVEAVVDTSNGRWRTYVDALDAARGPQTLAAFERLFVQSYIPLADAIDHGLAEIRAVDAREEFRRTFARAYSEAMPKFALTGKRPRMVLDAFDVAAKMARAHGARNAQVLVVDGMRFDLAAQIAARIAELAMGRATLADRVTLFSALPSSTPRQLESLARGVEALRSSTNESDAEPMRGRTADAIRRVRVGSRDLYKLDIVETTLANAGDGAIDTIEELTEDAARIVAKHVRAQSARTLVFIIGDHGFRFDGGMMKHGGASPEEVIVSGHAFVTADVH